MGERYMVFEEMLRDEREEGRKEELINTANNILRLKNIILSDTEQEKLSQEQNPDLWRKVIEIAVMASTEEEFHKAFSERN